ncbi:MAG: hypothetical protein KDD89_09165, partial [Anaerolineales bacterium]|nr:hypothetical protein [Anaerolineales bacterium]
MTHTRNILSATRRLILILMAIILFAPLGMELHASETVQPTDGEQALEALKSNFALSEAYQFTAQIEQTLIPRATAVNIGETEQRSDAQLMGNITPEKSTLDLRFEGGNVPNFSLEQEDGQMFLLRDGERTLIDNPLSTSAPDGSFAGYLHAATNVVERTDPDFPSYTIYQFDIDGQKLADYLMAEAQANLPQEQQYRVYSSAHTASLMGGTGEFWLDEGGVLRRQIVDIAIPEATDVYDIQAHIVIDYRYEEDTAVIYGLPDQINPAVPPHTTPDDTATSVEALINNSPFTLENGAYFAAALIAVSLLALLLIYLIVYHSRQLQVVIPFVLTFALVATPMLQVASAEAAVNRTAKPVSLLEALGLDQEEEENTTAEINTFTPQTSLLSQTQTQNADECGVSTDRTTDTDGDGLTDFVENCLGTNPYATDTDNDLINDYKEVTGFVFTDTVKGPITYYTNPFEPDSNFDGRSDFHEWPNRYKIDEWQNVADVTVNPWDLDGDNQPNLWDTDDDGDGVYDGLDINPEHVTNHQETFAFNLYQGDRTQPGVYTVIEFHVQPQEL